ncbi:MAG: hypothetical protein HY243_01825 [Proteobacteria bacterium]|nr:hypothetical protein [Pseudomonadota bacterium]
MNLLASRVTLSVLIAFAAPALVMPAFAGPRDDALQAVGKCAAIAEDKARLACYDQLATQIKSALATPPTAVAENKPPTKEEQESWFGFDLGGLFGPKEVPQTKPEQFGQENTEQAKAQQQQAETEGLVVDSISAGVTEYAFTPFGKFVVILDDGQVWKQIEGDSDLARFKKTPTDNKVTISRGFMGSYSLTINGSAKVYKVTRVK